jgi:hypothetical protein
VLLHEDVGRLAVLPLVSSVLVLFDPGTTDLLITGPGGEQTGMTDSGQVVDGIPGSAYFPAVPLAIIAAPRPGIYQVRVRGRAAGGYVLVSAASTALQVFAQQTSRGTLALGQTALYSMRLDATGTALTTVPIVTVPPPPPAQPPPSVPPPSGFGAGRDAFVLALYREVLGRTPEPRGLRYWSGLLFAGARPGVVAQAIWKSPEHARLLRLHVAPSFTFTRALSDALQAAARAI